MNRQQKKRDKAHNPPPLPAPNVVGQRNNAAEHCPNQEKQTERKPLKRSLWGWISDEAQPLMAVGTIIATAFVAAGFFYQAKTTRETIETAQKALAFDHRPWVMSSTASLKLVNELTDGCANIGLKITYRLRNFGNIPAQNAANTTQLWESIGSEGARPASPKFVMEPSSIAPEQDVVNTINGEMSCDDARETISGKRRLYVWVTYTYRNPANGEIIDGRDCFLWMPPGEPLAICPSSTSGPPARQNGQGERND